MAEVFSRPTLTKRLALSDLEWGSALAAYVDAVESARPISTPAVITAGPDDDQVVATAVAAEAELLATGDHDLARSNFCGAINGRPDPE